MSNYYLHVHIYEAPSLLPPTNARKAAPDKRAVYEAPSLLHANRQSDDSCAHSTQPTAVFTYHSAGDFTIHTQQSMPIPGIMFYYYFCLPAVFYLTFSIEHYSIRPRNTELFGREGELRNHTWNLCVIHTRNILIRTIRTTSIRANIHGSRLTISSNQQ